MADMEARGWRRIDSAPKDGTRVLVVHASGYMRMAYFGDFPGYGRKTWIGWGDGQDDFRIMRPTHWQSLPQPPEAEK